MPNNFQEMKLIESSRKCPDCGQSGGVTTKLEKVIELGVEYESPIRECVCGFRYTDYEHEEAQEKALRSVGRL